MSSVLRAAAVYGFLLLIFRLSGKRSLAQITTFDAVLLLIVSEAIQQALIDGDESMTNAFVLVVTLLGLDVLMSVLSMRSQRIDRIVNDTPLVLVEEGQFLEDQMAKARVTADDILEQARGLRGLQSADQIRYAILERSGGITVIPKPGSITWT